MPFAFIGLGLLLLVVAIRGTQNDLFVLLKSEFTGSNSFPVWALAIVLLGAVGYIKPLRPISDGLLFLVLLVIVLKNGGDIFAKFDTAVAHPVAPSEPAASTASTANTGTSVVTTAATGAWNVIAHPLTTMGSAIIDLPSNIIKLLNP